MDGIELVKNIAQIVYYVALSVSGPLALIGFLRAKKIERQEHEYKTYDELDNKFLAYQQLALEHDLDLMDVPDASLFFEGDRLRKKQALVAATVGLSLFQRAYLMFHQQSSQFKQRQWAGWERLLATFLVRDSVKDAWQIGKTHFDTGFRRFVDRKMVAVMQETGTDPAVIHAFEKTGLLIRDDNEHVMTASDVAAWNAALREYRAA
jgi:hypothetical protein